MKDEGREERKRKRVRNQKRKCKKVRGGRGRGVKKLRVEGGSKESERRN